MSAPYQHGSGTVILMDNSNPPTTEWATDLPDSKLSRKRKAHNKTNFGATAEGRQGGLYDLDFELTVRINATNHALLRTYNDAGTIYVRVRPFGTGTGLKQYQIQGFFEDFPMEAKADALVDRKLKFAVDGDWTESTQ